MKVNNFGLGLKWLNPTIIHVAGPMSYAVAPEDGRVSKTRSLSSIASAIK